jgi:hypothetical protein
MFSKDHKKATRLHYCQYLLSSQINYTLTNYAEHVAGVTHDTINRYLRNDKLTPTLIWEHTKEKINYSKNGYIVFDDSVLNKGHSEKIESVRWQYSGNAHGVIRGIGLVNCIYVNPETEEYWSIDYRIFDPECDGKSKMDHVADMINNAFYSKEIPFSTVLMDSWYASNKMMLTIHNLGKKFYCPVKKNRVARNFNSTEYYKPIPELVWTDEELNNGKPIRLKGMPRDFAMKMYQVPISTNRTDYVVTNDTSQICTDDVQKVCAMRWYIEQFHREIKQLTGVEKCQCRKRRIQRNHIACSILVWTRLKKLAMDAGTTMYQLKHNLLKEYLIQELKSPRLQMSFA